MNIKLLDQDFSVCKVTDYTEVTIDQYTFIAKTDEENSLVCPTDTVPSNTTRREDGWRAMRIEGELDFSLVGILSRISTLLADAGIGIFAISTYNTDYILTKDMAKAVSVLKMNGYIIL